MTFKPDICYEDNHLIGVNKPSGILSQGDATGDASIRDLMMNVIKVRDKKPGNVFLHPVHRLDRPVSGCLIMAKTSKALSRMTGLFKEKKVKKSYVALCQARGDALDFGQFTEIQGYIFKDSSRNMAVHKADAFNKAKKAMTNVERLGIIDNVHILKCTPITGRTHQIRVQLASIGYPIIGDKKYGGQRDEKGSIYLHSREAAFVHPVKREAIRIIAKFPAHGLWKSLNISQFESLKD